MIASAKVAGTARMDEWRTGWKLVLATILGIGFAPTVMPFFTLGIFLGPLEQSFGWRRSEIQAALFLIAGASALTAPLIGELVHRFGSRRVLLPSLFATALALGLATLMDGALWQLYAVYGIIAIAGAGAGVIVWAQIIASAFSASRGLALGLGLSGMGLSQVVMPQVITAAMADWGWRGAYATLAALVLCVGVPAALVAGRKSGDKAADPVAKPEHTESIGSILQQWRFWVIGISVALVYLAMSGITPNLVPALTDRGLPAAQAASLLSLFGVAVLIGRIATGALLDRFWAPGVSLCFLLPTAAAAASLAFFFDMGVIGYATAVIFIGMAAGMEADLMAFVTARYFGVRNFARYYSLLWIFVTAPAAVAPMLFAYVFDITGTYKIAFTAAAAIIATAGILLLFLGSYPKIDEEERASGDNG